MSFTRIPSPNRPTTITQRQPRAAIESPVMSALARGFRFNY